MPYFLVPRRRYPIFVYLFALDIYCSNLGKGQRAAAEETREKFGLKTFSHTTLGRFFRALEGSIEDAAREGCAKREPQGGVDAADVTMEGSAGEGAKREHAVGERAFPNAKCTAERREAMSVFLSGFHRAVEGGSSISDACRDIVKHWYERTSRLLI